jgi:hypothetical protein
MGARVPAAAAFVATLLVVPTMAQADTGAITGATINPEGTQVSVSNLAVEIDNCQFFDPTTGFAGCGAEAGLVPAFNTCPVGGNGMQSIWSAERAGTSGSRTMASGPRSAAVPSPVAYRVCLYGVHFSENFGEAIRLLAEAITPTPTPPSSGPTGRRAAALKKCKKKLPKGPKRKKCIKKAKKLPV